MTGDRRAAGRQRSLAATVEWSYQLLGEHDQQVFRQLSAFAGPFTLEAAEAVAGQGVAPVVARLVDCSLLRPPRAGPDGRSRYAMLETLRAYGSGLLAETGEQVSAAAALAGYAVRVAEQAAADLQTSTDAEVAAARWLDAEDATMRQVLGWALGWWWALRGRLAGQYALLRDVAGRAETGSDRWCATQDWLGEAALLSHSDDGPGMLDHYTRLRDAVAGRRPSRALADGLRGRATVFVNQARTAEAIDEGRRSLAVARAIGYPAGEVRALGVLSWAASDAGDTGSAVQLARKAAQITTGVPATAVRWHSAILTEALVQAGELAAAGEVCAAGLAWSRRVSDLGRVV